ncbi:hypothetical protein L195_g061136 [Trifolium pratense]|uniref:Uncharacterized protein n=1 Tax=Trifolium pratense TaxID=57577 RepID=A0A2K3K819_TRIPR|nr:hypothetical protein L195_g061136 [Trifolium pratense]
MPDYCESPLATGLAFTLEPSGKCFTLCTHSTAIGFFLAGLCSVISYKYEGFTFVIQFLSPFI